jgi:hypothetical protein
VNDLLKVVYFAERMMIEFDKMVVVYFAERLTIEFDKMVDSFCLDTQVAMQLLHHSNNSDIPLENGCKEKYKKEVIEKKKQVCEVSPSLYSEEVTDYKVVQPAIYRNPEINCQNVTESVSQRILLTSWLLDRLLKSPIGSFSKESPLFCPCNFSIVKQETSNSCVKPANKSSFSFKRLFTLKLTK